MNIAHIHDPRPYMKVGMANQTFALNILPRTVFGSGPKFFKSHFV